MRSFFPHAEAASKLKDYLEGQLANARIARAGDYAKRRGATDVAARILELRMVEYIEELCAKLGRDPLRDGGVFDQCRIEVDNPGPVEEPPVGISELSQRILTEKTGVEVWLRRRRAVTQVQASRRIVRNIEAAIDNAIDAEQGTVIGLRNKNRKA